MRIDKETPLEVLRRVTRENVAAGGAVVGITEPVSYVGTIWYTSWGYDQTNVEFFKCVRETPASLVLRRIGSKLGADLRVYPDPENPCIDWSITGQDTRWNERKRISEPNPNYARDHERGYSEKLCRKPRSDKWVSVRIDDVRTAFPYDGGGRYDTLAAGQPGH